MTLVLALDLATRLGFAYGAPKDEQPAFGSVSLGSAGASPDAVFAACMTWSRRFIANIHPDVLVIERLLPPEALKGKTSRQARDRLAGLQGIVRGAAREAGVFDISTVSVGDIRGHFIADRGAKRDAAKLAVMRRCRMLGWDVGEDDNAADACALWDYSVARIRPELALRTSPLFGPKGVAL